MVFSAHTNNTAIKLRFGYILVAAITLTSHTSTKSMQGLQQVCGYCYCSDRCLDDTCCNRCWCNDAITELLFCEHHYCELCNLLKLLPCIVCQPCCCAILIERIQRIIQQRKAHNLRMQIQAKYALEFHNQQQTNRELSKCLMQCISCACLWNSQLH